MWEAIIQTLPVAGPLGIVLVLLRIGFLRFIRDQGIAHQQERQLLGKRMDNVVDRQLAMQNEVIEKNTMAFLELRQSLHDMSNSLNGLKDGCAETRSIVRQTTLERRE